MASSEIDQKYLGHFAKVTAQTNPFLSSFCFRVLGLSVILSEKLLRARRTKRLDPVRDPSSRKLVHHILWLAREGLVMVEQYILPMVGNHVELRVLAYKLRASFYHIFVLFHNDPPVNRRTNHVRTLTYSLFPDPLSPRGSRISPPHQRTPESSTQTTTPGSAGYPVGGAVGGTGGTPHQPPGLPQPTTPKPTSSATYLLPLLDYTPTASACFSTANQLAESLLPGSHPIRLSVKVEYVAYMYDCLHAAEESRRMAKKSIRDVYEATEGMDDESFDDAAEMVGVLGRMMRRGLGTGSSGSGSGGGSGALSTRLGERDRVGNGKSGLGNGHGSSGQHQRVQSGQSGGRGNGSRQPQHSGQQSPKRRDNGKRSREGNGNGHGRSKATSGRGQTSTAPTTWV